MESRRGPRTRDHQGETYRELALRLAGNVERLRTKAGWSQEEAAHHCEMAPRLLQRIEAAGANVTLATLARFCDGFDVDLAALFRPARPKPPRGPGRPSRRGQARGRRA